MRILIETEPSLELVASVSRADAAVRAFDEMRPDLTLIDLDLPSGCEVIRQICRRSPGAWIIGLVMDELNVVVQEAMTVGASVVLAKHLTAEELMPLILKERQARLQRDPAKRSVAARTNAAS